jgi:hypothetical protein
MHLLDPEQDTTHKMAFLRKQILIGIDRQTRAKLAQEFLIDRATKRLRGWGLG